MLGSHTHTSFSTPYNLYSTAFLGMHTNNIHRQVGGKCQGYSPGTLPTLNLTLHNMAKDPLEGVSWEVNYQGKPCYSAYCDTEVLIISQDDSLQVAEAVPRLTCELTDDDKRQLERLDNLPQSSWNDDASIIAARHALDKRHTMIQVERNKLGEKLSKTKVQRIIRNIMKASTKPARK